MTGSPMKWQGKNQRSRLDVEFGADVALVELAAGFRRSSVMRSNISIGG